MTEEQRLAEIWFEAFDEILRVIPSAMRATVIQKLLQQERESRRAADKTGRHGRF